MKAILICPGARSEVGLLSEAVPLSNVPALGRSLLEYWLVHLACSGVKQVLVLANDRSEQVQALVGKGERWGLTIQVVPESRELTAAQALLKYQDDIENATGGNALVTMDHFPGLPEYPLFKSYADWFAGLQAWMPRAQTPDRVGVRQLAPGVWAGLHSHISPGAQLHAPCWVGENVFVGAKAVLGAGTIVEDGSFIEPAAELGHSYVGPDTFVGRYAEIKDSLAWGNTLINWKTGSLARVPDPFLLCALRASRARRSNGWLARLAELYARNKEDAHLVWKHLLMNKEG